MTTRALSFGSAAETYERYRAGYPDELVTRIVRYAGRPLRTAFEIGAGTGKLTRVLVANGISVTATDPDPAMLAELRRHVDVPTLQCTLEEAPTDQRYDLVIAAASLHWTVGDGRWERVAALLEPGGVVVCTGGPFFLVDADVDAAVKAARAPFIAEDGIPQSSDLPSGERMFWPGDELTASELFTDVVQDRIPRPLTISAADYLGYVSSVSAYLHAPVAAREGALSAIAAVLPETVEVNADVWFHAARRT